MVVKVRGKNIMASNIILSLAPEQLANYKPSNKAKSKTFIINVKSNNSTCLIEIFGTNDCSFKVYQGNSVKS